MTAPNCQRTRWWRIWAVYGLLLLAAIPWYWPRDVAWVWFGVPAWVFVALAVSFIGSMFTVYALFIAWPEPEQGDDFPGDGE